MRPAYAREVLVVLVHLAFWSQLGVLTRIYLDIFFSAGCTGSWGLCLTSTGTFHARPPQPMAHACGRQSHGAMSTAGVTRNSLGTYFPDLASNMLGSFLMGLLAASSTLGQPTNKAIAILPHNSAWQVPLSRTQAACNALHAPCNAMLLL